MAGRMQDKVTIITGSGSGIGAACFELFAREGATVIGCGRRLAPLEEQLAKVKSAGGQGMVLSADLSKAEDCNRLIAETIKAYGRVDALVHSASVGWSWSHVSPNSMNDVLNTPPDKWHEVVGINMNPVYYLCHAVLPHMLARKKGSLTMVASISGMVGMKTAHTYCAAKGGVINLVRAMANTYASQGVRANAVCPGWVRTAMADEQMQVLVQRHSLPDADAAYALVTREVPLGRPAEAAEVADAVLFLASARARMVSGTFLMVDGGASAVDLPTTAFAR